MGKLRQQQCLLRPQKGSHGVKPMGLVKLLILSAIYHIKAANPQHHCQKQHHHGVLHLTCHSHPGTGRSHGYRHAADVVAKAGEPLHIRVNNEGQSRHRQKLNADRIQLQHGENQHSKADCQQKINIPVGYQPCHHRPFIKPRLILVILQINHVVQGQRRTTGRHNSRSHPQHRPPVSCQPVHLVGQKHRHIGKGQGKHYLIKSDIAEMGIYFLPKCHIIHVNLFKYLVIITVQSSQGPAPPISCPPWP